MAFETPKRTLSAVFTAAALALCIAAALLSSGCSAPAEPVASPAEDAPVVPAKPADQEPLRVAVQYNALSIPTVFAYENGYFSEAGLDVELSTFANGAEENKAIEAGKADLASDGLASVYLLASGNFSWIGESDSGSATVAIYIREGAAPTQVSGQLPDNPEVLGSADTLRGLTVIGQAGTMEEWVAVSYFSQFGLSAGTDFEFVEADRESAVKSVVNGEADIFVASDADYARVMEDNGFVALATGAEATGIPFNNGYLVSNKVLQSRRDDLVVFLQAVYRAAETLNGNPELWNQFAYEFYRENGKPSIFEDVQQESQLRPLLVPADFTAPDYYLGAGVLDVGQFHADIGALDESQVGVIESSIDTSILEEAFGITVKKASYDDGRPLR